MTDVAREAPRVQRTAWLIWIVLGLVISIVVAMDHGIVGVPAGFADARALIASIVAISGIHLLKIFMDIGKFTDRDLYLVVYGLDGVVHAHGANEKMIGKNLIDLKDVDGTVLAEAKAGDVTIEGTNTGKLEHDLGIKNGTKTALLKPGETFEYSSWAQIATPQGRMAGTFFCISEDAHWFETPVGPFDLVQTRALH